LGCGTAGTSPSLLPPASALLPGSAAAASAPPSAAAWKSGAAAVMQPAVLRRGARQSGGAPAAAGRCRHDTQCRAAVQAPVGRRGVAGLSAPLRHGSAGVGTRCGAAMGGLSVRCDRCRSAAAICRPKVKLPQPHARPCSKMLLRPAPGTYRPMTALLRACQASLGGRARARTWRRCRARPCGRTHRAAATPRAACGSCAARARPPSPP